MMMDLKNLSTEQMKAEFLEIKIANLKKIEFEKQLNQKKQRCQNKLISSSGKFYK